MLSLLGFGKKRRVNRSRKARKSHKKPPATLLKACKVCGIKCTKKVGGKRVYKSARLLKKQCLKKLRAMKKRAMKKLKSRKGKKSRKVSRKGRKVHRKKRRVVRREAFGEDSVAFGRRTRFGNMPSMSPMMPKTMFGAMQPMPPMPRAMFGKRRSVVRTRKVSKAHAMKAFRSFYKRHCAGARRTRFGSGGNPPLSQSMGYEFCPSGMGGVLGANSTGLFPTPCVSMNQAQANAEATMQLPSYTSYGRRRYRKKAVKRMVCIGSKKRSTAVGAKRRSTAIGRRSKAKSVKRKMYVGANRMY